MQKQDLKSSSQSRGKRLKSLRMLADLSRKALEKKYQISASTIQSWEDGKAGGLTEKGAWRVISALRKEGVQCSVEWLLYGAGIGPQLTEKESSQLHESVEEYYIQKNRNGSIDDNAIMQELLTFRKYNEGAIDMVIIDDAMAPIYCEGDYVAGKKRCEQEVASLIGHDCIVETAQGEILLRRLKSAQKEGLFTLLNTNPNTTLSYPVIYDVKIVSAAPVAWHRKKDKLK